MNKILMGDYSLPAWMRHGLTVLCQKGPRKVNTLENSCPSTCLALMSKLLTRVIVEEIYDF